MKDFLVNYGRLILEVLLVIASVVIAVIRKKPLKVVDSVKALLIGLIPTVLNRVENYTDVFDPSRKLSGQEKLTMALNIFKSYMVDELGIPEDQLCLYREFLVENIEAVLSTPQKKEVKVDEN